MAISYKLVKYETRHGQKMSKYPSQPEKNAIKTNRHLVNIACVLPWQKINNIIRLNNDKSQYLSRISIDEVSHLSKRTTHKKLDGSLEQVSVFAALNPQHVCNFSFCFRLNELVDIRKNSISAVCLWQLFFIYLAPELVIYDNSCTLHEYCLNHDPAFFKYCLNHDPAFFKNTKFVVDKFHWKNHTGTWAFSFKF
jgi:hypothetical protein